MIKSYIRLGTLCLIFISSINYTQEKMNPPILSKRVGIQISYWYEPSFKSGSVLGIDWEFLNKKGHGVGLTFPSLRFFVFPYNSFSLSFYTALSYRYVHPKNGFYTSLALGLGLDAQWLIVPLYNMNGDQIRDPGLVRLFALAQWDIGYDFAIRFAKPVRLFASFGWNGRYPTNLGINSHMFFQIGVNVKISDLVRK
ncbi:MAG: hypothetical protein ACRCV0_04235 [Brevinema sp.]